MNPGPHERHWVSAATALAGLFAIGYFYEPLRQLVKSDILFMAVILVVLLCLNWLGNYLANKVRR
jgi:hypothetical protein